MRHITRRRLLQQGMGSAAFLGLGAWGRAAVRGANETVRVAVAGIHNQGNGHIGRFQGIDGVEVVALVDPDAAVLAQRRREFEKRYGRPVDGYADVRRVLDRTDVDVLVIAAPNHWHSLMTVWACQAGKDVYVEKPVSHSIWEGRQMVRAARRYDRIVQAGTQQRSCPAVQAAARDIQAGKYGRVQWVHCSKLGSREGIGRVTGPQPVPDSVDYNLWAGPAPRTPLLRRQFHYDWHWQWPWGDGEMANWGVHYLDDVRHLLGWDSVPTRLRAVGNRFAWHDDGQTPNMHLALAHYGDVPLVIDIRNLPDPARRGGKGGAVYLKMRGGNVIQCEHATIRLARGGGGAYDAAGKRIHQYKGDGGAGHTRNFIAAVRSRRRQDLAAEIIEGHLSTVMCHQANVAWRVGRPASVASLREALAGHEDAANTLTDMLEQLAGNGVDLVREPFLLGPELTYDCQAERFTGDGADAANAHLRVPYRPGFVMPETV